jgi:hypothetical protein
VATRRQPAAPVSLPQYQTDLRRWLQRRFPGMPVESEWVALRDERAVYSPRLDVAVGPFAFEVNHRATYDRMVSEHEALLRNLFDAHRANLVALNYPADHFDFHDLCSRNANARCFLAVEIENEVSRKHLMGGAINAAALGRIGIAIGWTQRQVNALVRMRAYLLFLASVGKNTFHPVNLMVLGSEQVATCLRRRRIG